MERSYFNWGENPKGERATAAWLISRHVDEKTTAIKAEETKQERINFSIPAGVKGVTVEANFISFHGLPTEFGKPAAGELVLQESRSLSLSP